MTPESWKLTWMAAKGIVVATKKAVPVLSGQLQKAEFSESARQFWDMMVKKYELKEGSPVGPLILALLSQHPDVDVNLLSIVTYLAEHGGTNIDSVVRDSAAKLVKAYTYVDKLAGTTPEKEAYKQKFDTWSVACIT